MEELRRSIGLRSYGQKDPLVEYKSEAYRFFEELMTNVRLQICTGLFRSASNLSTRSRTCSGSWPATSGPRARKTPPAPPAAPARQRLPRPRRRPARARDQLPKVTIRRDTPKVGRNDPCPCGSGKKYKHCHGA